MKVSLEKRVRGANIAPIALTGLFAPIAAVFVVYLSQVDKLKNPENLTQAFRVLHSHPIFISPIYQQLRRSMALKN